MASSTFLNDLEEKFFQCPVCLELFQEPKLLPCLHRYCYRCLRTVVDASLERKIKCPMCKDQCVIPDNGIDGFKSDFHMKSLVEFIQLQRAHKNKDLRKCVSCFKETHVSAYCFKCKDFLCEQCYKIHITSKMFTDHKPRVLKLDKTDGRNITLEKLATLREDPRCRTHVEENAKLCCSTCVNEPICMICTYSKHKGHGLHDVTELAKIERDFLESKISELQKLKSKLYRLPSKVEASTRKLNENVYMKTNVLLNQHQQQVNKIKQSLRECKIEKEEGLADIEKERKAEERQTNFSYEQEIYRLNKKYDKIRKTFERKYNSLSQVLKDNFDQKESELVGKLEHLDISLKSITESKNLLTMKHEEDLRKLSDNCYQVIKRYENFTAIASSILAAKDEWAQVQCIPNIRAACVPLIEEMKKKYPQLDSLSDVNIRDMPNLVTGGVSISQHEQSAVYVERLKSINGKIDEITINKNFILVVSGTVSNEYSHITVIDRKGKIQRQDKFKRVKQCDVHPARYCCYLSEFKVATVCMPNEIGIYDVRDGSYNRKYISDIVRNRIGIVWCVTNDPVKNHIIVGTSSRFVYTFDDQLNYIRTITLPKVITGVNDITVQASKFLICDYDGKGAYVVITDGSKSKLMHEFTKPDLTHVGGNVRPCRVCTDNNDFIYMLWRTYSSDRLTHTLVHYSQDGRQILTRRTVDGDSSCVATVEVGGSEKLVTATRYSGKVSEYGITSTVFHSILDRLIEVD